ncbi:MAG: insulinase family protein [Phycisphaerales bacterium]
MSRQSFGVSSLAFVLTLIAGTSAALAQGSATAKVNVKDSSSAVAKFDLSAPLPTDPRLNTGELPNGMKYIVVKHSNPPGRVNMYIHISSGSMNETDKQRGIAHFLEHMAFNGSENFPPGTVINFFQSMGLNFGQHQNAFTSFDQTTYILSMPDTKPETLDKGMSFFADVSGRLLLDAGEIDKERGIILEEKTSRSSAQQRISDQTFPKMFPGSRIGVRMPIGTEETIKGVQRQDFVDYVSKWYQPSNMTLIFVADAEPATIIEHIKKNFGTVGKKTPTPIDEPINVTPYTDDGAIIAQDNELTEADISMIRVSGARKPSTTVGDLRRDMVEQIASSAFGRRIADKLSAGGTSYTSAMAFGQNMFNAAFMSTCGASGEPGKWREMLTELGADVQQARLHGFTQRELDLVKKEIISGAETAVQRESTMPGGGLIRRINNDIASGEPTVGAQQMLDLTKGILPSITAEEVSATFASMFEPKNVRFMLTLPSNVSAPSEAELLTLGKQAFNVTPAKKAEEARATSLMSDLPKAGTFTNTSVHDATGIATGTLSNGVTVHHRFMDIQKDSVNVTISLAAGEIQETAKDRGIAQTASLAWGQRATSKLSSQDIRELMTGKKVNVRGGAGGDTMTLSISGSPADLETGFQLAHLLLTDPKIEQSVFDQAKVQIKQWIEGRKMDAEGVFQELMPIVMFGENEPRVRMLETANVDAMSIDAAQAWLNNAIKTSPIEVTVVGDISKDRAMELCAQYLGSLPPREAISDKTLANLRTIAKPTTNREIRREVKTDTDKALVLAGFYGADATNLVDSRTLQAAAQIIRSRCIQILREEKQLVYSAGVSSRPGREYPGFGVVAINSTTAPEKCDTLAAEAWKIFDEFAANGPTEEEMTTMKKQMANTMDEQFKQPGFWSQRTSEMAYRAMKADDIMTMAPFYQELTAQQIKEVFNKYYKPEAKMTLIVTPEKK